jgi:hypothetical protein
MIPNPHYRQYRAAYAAAQADSIRTGGVAIQAASPEVEAKLSKLLGVTAAMFCAAVGSVVTAGMILF